MKTIGLSIYMFFLSLTLAKAQTHCSQTIVTSTPTVTVWDWRTETWDCKITSNVNGGVITSVNSPFYSLDNLANNNISKLTSALVKDYQIEDRGTDAAYYQTK
jgi:hypothetical protein